MKKTVKHKVSKTVDEGAGVAGKACTMAVLCGVVIIVAWLVMEQAGVKFFAL